MAMPFCLVTLTMSAFVLGLTVLIVALSFISTATTAFIELHIFRNEKRKKAIAKSCIWFVRDSVASY